MFVLYLFCPVLCLQGRGFNSPGQFLCWCTAPFDVCLVLDLKSGGIALTLLGAGHSPQIQKNLPDAGHFIVERGESIPSLWRFVLC